MAELAELSSRLAALEEKLAMHEDQVKSEMGTLRTELTESADTERGMTQSTMQQLFERTDSCMDLIAEERKQRDLLALQLSGEPDRLEDFRREAAALLQNFSAELKEEVHRFKCFVEEGKASIDLSNLQAAAGAELQSRTEQLEERLQAVRQEQAGCNQKVQEFETKLLQALAGLGQETPAKQPEPETKAMDVVSSSRGPSSGPAQLGSTAQDDTPSTGQQKALEAQTKLVVPSPAAPCSSVPKQAVTTSLVEPKAPVGTPEATKQQQQFKQALLQLQQYPQLQLNGSVTAPTGGPQQNQPQRRSTLPGSTVSGQQANSSSGSPQAHIVTRQMSQMVAAGCSSATAVLTSQLRSPGIQTAMQSLPFAQSAVQRFSSAQPTASGSPAPFTSFNSFQPLMNFNQVKGTPGNTPSLPAPSMDTSEGPIMEI
eukprot:TRINITY_DN61298_c0_g1_i1.p1 TRINITY_DN61298_c0_g1~~TRINITY_DN61298_c0_g1_i1.p1  ORF type:complete len:448 (+),score=99.35 TRINITY_DN61298_c0_g1_i1:61-1344(+)